MYNLKIIISKRGFIIPLSLNNKEELNMLLKQLMIYTKFDNIYFKKQEIIKLWINEDNKFLIIPRFFKYNNFKFSVIKNILDSKIKNIAIIFNGSLNEQQEKVITNTKDNLINDYNILYCLPCGFGKTVLSIYWICKLKIKTFILVHKEEILKQWVDRLKQFTDLTDTDIGIIQGSNKKVSEDNKIIIGMIQTIMTDKFDDSILPLDNGLLICDECHHLGAQQFNKAIRKIPTKYYISLSATPYRKDGLEDVYKSYLGYNEYKQEREFKDNVIIYKCNYVFNEDFKKNNESILNNIKQFSNLTTLITNEEDRNKKIINLIDKLLNQKRKILILSNRIKHLDYLYLNVKEKNKETIISRLYGKYRENINNCDILFSTYSLASEGLDIKTLNTLILAAPMTNIIQCCGRIMRENNGTDRFIFDVIDDIVYNFYYVRKRHYLQFTDKIQNYNF